jgi:murein DD-endopeptidase MepM/ murein hydrolase activator NlpD
MTVPAFPGRIGVMSREVVWKLFACAIVLIVAAAPLTSARAQNSGGGVVALPTDDDSEIAAKHPANVERARRLGLVPPPDIDRPLAGKPRSLDFPLRLQPGAKFYRGHGVTNFVDLDPAATLRDYACNQRTYNGHNGTDFGLAPYMWRMMDLQQMDIVAAAPGTIIDKHDGEFDRQCTGPNVPANQVTVAQDDGLFAYYWHMKNGSVTPLAVGSRVAAGDLLGKVGSSGTSTGPHLHFEMRTAASFGGVVADPFKGSCQTSAQLWRHQPDNIDTEVLAVTTHAVAPPSGSNCDNSPGPNPQYTDVFAVGATVFGAVHLRDQVSTTAITIAFVRPDGTIQGSFSPTPGSALQPLTFWWTSTSVSIGGTWKVRATVNSRTYEHSFIVGPAPAQTTLTTTASPRTLNANGAPAEFRVVVRNIGAAIATGCFAAPDLPFRGRITVQAVRSDGSPRGGKDRNFNISAGAAIILRVTLDGVGLGNAMTFPIRVECLNANGPANSAANTVKLTF